MGEEVDAAKRYAYLESSPTLWIPFGVWLEWLITITLSRLRLRLRFNYNHYYLSNVFIFIHRRTYCIHNELSWLSRWSLGCMLIHTTHIHIVLTRRKERKEDWERLCWLAMALLLPCPRKRIKYTHM